ncbi:c-type cytochrome [Marinimicrobium agarilyticum]|uniref:c-type cytochrome n=1 Tax=Marinimicrobium agarilyticum TaxID=306546 RepID=UPI0004240950|nr:cytochrome c [Marinimicrobium agarilyticum]
MKHLTVFRTLILGLTASLITVGCSDGREAPPQETLTPEEQLIATGRRQARSCFGCHGPEGRSRVESYPTLAGRSQEYISEQLHAFRSGERENPMMSSIARNLDDQAIEALSAYFASVPEKADE